MKEHYSVDEDAPDETVYGEEIEYVYLVVRDHTAGREAEILGVFESEDDARKHAKIADRAGETTLRQQRLVPKGGFSHE